MMSISLEALWALLPWIGIVPLLYSLYSASKIYRVTTQSTGHAVKPMLATLIACVAVELAWLFGVAREGVPAEHGTVVLVVVFNLMVLFFCHYLVKTIDELTSVRSKNARLTGYDTRSGLPSRNMLMTHLKQKTEAAEPFSLAIVSLNRFKPLYESLGEAVGDRLLRAISERLTRLDQLFIAQVATHEIVMVLDNADPLRILNFGKNVVQSQTEAYDINGLKLYVDLSIGVACWPDHASDVSTLFSRADVALERSHVAVNRCHIYRPEYGNSALKRMQRLAELRRAIDGNELSIMFQPIVEQVSQRIIGAEALVRWFQPDGTQVFPDEFIPLAEQERCITRLSDWVLDSALQSFATWYKAFPDLHLHVNLATADIQDPNCWSRIEKALLTHGVDNHALVVEITESGITHDPEIAAKVVKQIAAHGVGIAIDDFGVGFSSLERLRNLPVGEIKIDRSFVRDMVAKNQDKAIVESTIHLAKNLNCKVTAEGVESGEVADILEAFGCEQLQGFFFGRPVSAEAFFYLLNEQRALESAHGASPAEMRKLIEQQLRA